jgi:hypothetical protein
MKTKRKANVNTIRPGVKSEAHTTALRLIDARISGMEFI